MVHVGDVAEIVYDTVTEPDLPAVRERPGDPVWPELVRTALFLRENRWCRHVEHVTVLGEHFYCIAGAYTAANGEVTPTPEQWEMWERGTGTLLFADYNDHWAENKADVIETLERIGWLGA